MSFISSLGEWLRKVSKSFMSATISGKTITLTRHNGDTVTLTTQDTTYEQASQSTSGLMSATDKSKLDGIASGAEVNQNAFSNVKVGSTTVAADAKTDTIELVAGTNVTLTPDATNDKITIVATDTTYSDATQSAHGLMSVNDKKKLDGITAGAEPNQNAFASVLVGNTNVAADVESDTLTLVAGSNITLTIDATNNKITIAATDTVYTHPTTAGYKHIPSGGSANKYLKYSTSGTAVWGDAVTLDTAQTLTASKTIKGNDKGWIVENDTYHIALAIEPSGVKRGVWDETLQNWLIGYDDSKLHVGPYTIEKSVPSNAKFTDTVYTHPTTSGNKHIPSGGSSGQILRWSADGTAVWGNDNNTTYSVATSSANGLMSSTDKKALDSVKDKKYAISTTGNISVANSTDTNISSYKFTTTGVYLVHYTLNFRKVSSTGVRQLVVSNTSGGGSIDQTAVSTLHPPSAGYCFVQLTRLEKITTANTTRYLVATQTSGAAMNVSGSITVARLGDA